MSQFKIFVFGYNAKQLHNLFSLCAYFVSFWLQKFLGSFYRICVVSLTTRVVQKKKYFRSIRRKTAATWLPIIWRPMVSKFQETSALSPGGTDMYVQARRFSNEGRLRSPWVFPVASGVDNLSPHHMLKHGLDFGLDFGRKGGGVGRFISQISWGGVD